ncbi:MAG: hypothetical protein ACRCYO_03255 [Bacteroidia bacterium]
MESLKSILLPLAALLLTLAGISYSACHESKANSPQVAGVQELHSELKSYQQAVEALQLTHTEWVEKYAKDMGCNSQSVQLEAVKQSDSLIQSYQEQLKYHQLELLQADTTDTIRNSRQLIQLRVELSKINEDLEALKKVNQAYNSKNITK